MCLYDLRWLLFGCFESIHNRSKTDLGVNGSIQIGTSTEDPQFSFPWFGCEANDIVLPLDLSQNSHKCSKARWGRNHNRSRRYSRRSCYTSQKFWESGCCKHEHLRFHRKDKASILGSSFLLQAASAAAFSGVLSRAQCVMSLCEGPNVSHRLPSLNSRWSSLITRHGPQMNRVAFSGTNQGSVYQYPPITSSSKSGMPWSATVNHCSAGVATG